MTTCHAFKMLAADGKMRKTDVATAEQLFRLIQSIPPPKTEPAICIIFGLVYFGMILGRFPCLKIGRPAIALVGAVALLAGTISAGARRSTVTIFI